MAKALGNNRYEGDFGMPKLPGEPLYYTQGDYVRQTALALLSREIVRGGVPGSAAEVGVYRGSFAQHINRLFHDRALYLFDTFEGFDAADIDAGRQAGFSETVRDWSDTNAQAVISAMPYPQKVILIKGRFPKTAAGIDDLFCFANLDADLYLPTLEGLRYFWPRLSPGGCLMVHDYNNAEYPGVAGALREFCDGNGIRFLPLPDICGSAVLIKP